MPTKSTPPEKIKALKPLPRSIVGYQLTWWAACKGDVAMLKLLLAYGARINAQRQGTSALHSAICWGHPAAVQFLVDRGADTRQRTLEANQWGISNATPLEVAQARKANEAEAILKKALVREPQSSGRQGRRVVLL